MLHYNPKCMNILLVMLSGYLCKKNRIFYTLWKNNIVQNIRELREKTETQIEKKIGRQSNLGL